MSYIVFFPRHDKGGGLKFLGNGKVALGRANLPELCVKEVA